MLPHPNTVSKITTLRYHERLQDVARQRRVINLDASAPSQAPALSLVRLALVAWLTALVARVHPAKWRRSSSSQRTNRPARSMQRVA
jgi:hypothetical protein